MREGLESCQEKGQEATQWFKSPISERIEHLRALAEIEIKPFYGGRRRVKLRHTVYTIGSAANCTIRLDDPYLSQRHAELRWAPEGRYEIVDLGSRNGTLLNGTRVLRAPLPVSGILQVGRSRIQWSEAASNNGAGDLPPAFVAESPEMLELVRRVRVAAQSDLSVLLLGETGTGKDELARLVHQWSGRKSGPFVALNAATMGGNLVDSELFGHRKGAYTGSGDNRQGALTLAHRGMLFLDEIGDLPSDTQAKLLRSLESGEVKALGADSPTVSNFRLVSATSRPLLEAVRMERFRPDLFYRISGFVLTVPPLRERRADILAITRKLLDAESLNLATECEGLLHMHSWPGNVRELRALIQRAICLCKAAGRLCVLPEDLEFTKVDMAVPATRTAEAPSLCQIERAAIESALLRHGWSRQLVAKELGIARSTLYEKMLRYGITCRDDRRQSYKRKPQESCRH